MVLLKHFRKNWVSRGLVQLKEVGNQELLGGRRVENQDLGGQWMENQDLEGQWMETGLLYLQESQRRKKKDLLKRLLTNSNLVFSYSIYAVLQ